MKVNDPMAAHKSQRKVFTYEDWQKLPEDSGAYELIEGELVMSPSPQVIHQKLSTTSKGAKSTMPRFSLSTYSSKTAGQNLQADPACGEKRQGDIRRCKRF